MMSIRILLATAAFLGLADLTYAVEPPECGGKNMLPELATTAPKLSARLATAETDIPNGQAVLWRITDRSGKVASSLLFGTLPSTSTKIHVLPIEVRGAIEKASVVALQLKELVDPNAFRLAFTRHPRFMVMPNGQNMWDLIPDEDEGSIRSAPQITPDRIAGMSAVQPWVLTFTLSFPMCEFDRLLADLPTLDRSIGQMALARNIPLAGLESVEEMMAAFAKEPLDSQARYLVATAKIGNRLTDVIETYEQLYLTRRISSIQILSLQGGIPTDQPDSARVAYVEDNFLNLRNQIVLERSLPMVAKGNALIVVSTIRLPGEHGLVELFRKAGYEVTPVN